MVSKSRYKKRWQAKKKTGFVAPSGNKPLTIGLCDFLGSHYKYFIIIIIIKKLQNMHPPSATSVDSANIGECQVPGPSSSTGTSPPHDQKIIRWC